MLYAIYEKKYGTPNRKDILSEIITYIWHGNWSYEEIKEIYKV